MADITPSQYILGTILFTFFILGGLYVLNEFRSADSNYGDQAKLQQFEATFKTMDDLNSSVSSVKESIKGAKVDPGAFGYLSALMGSSWQALRSLFDTFAFMDTVFGGLSSFFGLPVFVGKLIILALVIIIAFAIYGAIFWRRM